MGLDSVGTEIYAIHGYFRGLTIGQRTPEFFGVSHVLSNKSYHCTCILTRYARQFLASTTTSLLLFVNIED